MNAQVIKEEEYFFALFNQVFEILNNPRVPDELIHQSIQKVVDYFRDNKKPAGACAADRFSSLADFLAYFYWNSPISAAVTRDKAMAALQHCREFHSCFRRQSVKLVSVGGGTGSDLVGLYSALYENSTFEEIEVSLIENIEKWRLFAQELIRLLREYDFGDAGKLVKSRRFSDTFMCADMTDALSPRFVEVLKEANLVWMKGFLSTLANDFERFCVTEKIVSSMTPGALLVIMESPAYDRFEPFVEGNKLRRLENPPTSTPEGGYKLRMASEPKYRIINNTNQEIIIFERI